MAPSPIRRPLNYAGPDSFTYRANDGIDSGTIATVTILVNQVNDPPFTEPDAFNAMLNQPLDVPAPGVLANDHDVEVEDTAPMHTQLVSDVSHGTLTLARRTARSATCRTRTSSAPTRSPTRRSITSTPRALCAEDRDADRRHQGRHGSRSASGTVSTGTGVSAGDPLNSAVTTPTPAIVAIAQGVISGSASPSGYTFLNQQVNITLTNPTDGSEVTAIDGEPAGLHLRDRHVAGPGRADRADTLRSSATTSACPIAWARRRFRPPISIRA